MKIRIRKALRLAIFITLCVVLSGYTVAEEADGIIQIDADNRKVESTQMDEQVWEKITQSFYDEKVDPNFAVKTRVMNKRYNYEPGSRKYETTYYINKAGEMDVWVEAIIDVGSEEVELSRCLLQKDKLFKIYRYGESSFTSETIKGLKDGTEKLFDSLIPYSIGVSENEDFTPGGFVISEEGQAYLVFCYRADGPDYARKVTSEGRGGEMQSTIEEYMKSSIVRELLLNSQLDLDRTKAYPVMRLVMPGTMSILFYDGKYEYISFPVGVKLAPHDYVFEEDYFEYTFEKECLYPVKFVMGQQYKMYLAYERCPKEYSAFPPPQPKK